MIGWALCYFDRLFCWRLTWQQAALEEHDSLFTHTERELSGAVPLSHMVSKVENGGRRNWPVCEGRHIQQTHTEQETDREAERERRFQLQSPTNTWRHTLTLHTDQIIISGNSTIRKKYTDRQHHLQTKSPLILSCLILWGWVLTQQKFPAGEIPLLEVNRGEKEEGLSPCLPASERFHFESPPDGCTEHHPLFCVSSWYCICARQFPPQPM